MQDFRELKVWEKGHRLTLAVYKTTAKLTKIAFFHSIPLIRSNNCFIFAGSFTAGSDSKPELKS